MRYLENVAVQYLIRLLGKASNPGSDRHISIFGGSEGSGPHEHSQKAYSESEVKTR